MSSIINPLLQQYKNVQLDLIVSPQVKNLFVNDERINKLMTLRSYNLPLIVNRDKLRIIAYSARHPYDMYINLDSSQKAERVARLIRAKQKFGPPYQQIEQLEETHAVEIYRRFYQYFLSQEALQLAYPSICASSFASIQEKFSLDTNYIVLNTTNSSMAKSSKRNHRAWPTAYWQQLIVLLTERYPQKQIVMARGSHSLEIEFVESLVATCHNANLTCVSTSISELIALIAHAELLVCTDTGPLHIAAAVNTPIVTLFGPSDKHNTGPFVPAEATHVRVLQSDIACRPCQNTVHYKNCPKNQCMLDLNPEYVFSYVDAVLKQQ